MSRPEPFVGDLQGDRIGLHYSALGFRDDAKVFNDKLHEWEDYYNYHRPHGGLDGQTPYERLKQRTSTPKTLEV